TIEKVADIYKADDYRKIIKDGDRLLAQGTRAIHLLTKDDEGNLIELDELPLWGILDAYFRSEFSFFDTCENYVFALGTNWGEQMQSRMYKALIEDNTLTLVDSINFYGDEWVSRIILVNDHLFIKPHYNSYETLSVYNIELEIVAEYNCFEFFHNTWLYKINEQYIYTWDDDIADLMYIFDVSDVCNIQEIAQINFAENFPEVPDVRIAITKIINDSTLCMCYTGQYTFFDISDIANWQLLGTIDFPFRNALYNLAVHDEDRIIIPLYNGCVALYDVSNFEDPFLLSIYSYDFYYNLDGCVSFDNCFYRVDSRLGIHQFTIENDQFEYLETFPFFNGIGRIKITNDFLVILTGSWQGMHFYDISDINNIQYICTNFDNYYQYGCDIENNFLAVTLTSHPDNNSSIDIYDATNIEYLELVNRIEDVHAYEVFLEYPYLYALETVYGSYEYHFVKYDISTPFNTQIIYDYDLSPYWSGFYKYGDYAYYRGSEESIFILGNLDSDNPEIMGILDIDESFAFWENSTDYITVQKFNNYIDIYSLENPIEPELIFEYPFTMDNLFSGINDNLFFVGKHTIDIFDIEDGFNNIDPLYSLELPFNTSIRYFLERDDEDYVLFTASTGVSLYRYNYDNSDSNNEIYTPTFILSNHPNPFNPSTIISFELSTETNENTEIVIFNSKGQRVKQLQITNYELGINEVVWDGKDENNKPVASGVYMYQLRVNDTPIASRKCLLLK
ncbi:MAG: T9SS type A sorting domain-containing protein, partial [Candidatus Cloacimonetes bacterium]|nr:T9SS type A sorting domain-containing protein [Candidatus Cloacimonadota bacterium]